MIPYLPGERVRLGAAPVSGVGDPDWSGENVPADLFSPRGRCGGILVLC
jgi:hypothetical protein